ncbi:regulatory protein ToxS [Vibrio scophthalmi]|uniref:Transmembrane regulatory protein ToxS n=2 Tax=Vibrio scophthalmi TaxID=45658 RepID=A0A1B1NLZ6_9VIBR|nr:MULTISPECIES: regulatory protein ToxS [Vibrio]ANS84739.1 Transmembrane regulatory protein ToxS [Vibrio scophthalmi]ANU37153.1 Transmembrane regulatory protein ToxS [Vibrio scophthalmi]EGU31160.1 transmembrane regulatory protein ToxS [Vibrio sp. N418]EGU40002.1 transmembrane regulatory protein ToxS [Vibrio scophthalmi LMG 19158]MCY9802290.1 regulatory protein ToxS [Vibrio scophthalmi]
MNQKLALALLAVSVLFSGWLYLDSDFQVEKTITSKEWQSKMVTVISDNLQEETVGPLRKVDVVSNVKYLPNGTYIRVATIRLFANSEQSDSVINISETGDWEISDNYLLISPKEFKDVSSAQSKDFTDVQLQLIKQLFKMDSQLSRRIDIVNDKTLLLTSLSHGSTVLFSN